MSRRHIEATNLFVYWIIFCENLCLRNIILSQQQVATNQITEFVRNKVEVEVEVEVDMLRSQILSQYKICPVHTKRFVTVMCHRNVLLALKE